MKRFLKVVATTGLIALGFPISLGLAEDTDIYAANRASYDNPNVLIILDNTTNWSRNSQHWEITNDGVSTSQGEMELKALYQVLGELSDQVNVGLMMMTEGQGQDKTGAYLRFHIRPMNETNKAALMSLISDTAEHLLNPEACIDGLDPVSGTPKCILKHFDSTNEKINVGQASYSNTLFEAYKYFGGYTSPPKALMDVGGTPRSASQFGPFRYTGTPGIFGGRADQAAYKPAGQENPPCNGTDPWCQYNFPGDPVVNCGKNYIIWVGNEPKLSSDAPLSLLQGVEGNTAQAPWPALSLVTKETEALLSTSTCGEYATPAACQTAAALAFPGYASYRCEDSGTTCGGSPVTTSTSLGTSVCGRYTSASACQADLQSTYGTAYDSYQCTVASACSTPVSLSPSAVMTNSLCMTANNTGQCVTLAATLYPGYADFSCTKDTTATCPSKQNAYRITAAQQLVSGNTYTMVGNKTSTSGGISHRIYGTAAFDSYVQSGTLSLSETPVYYADEWARFLFQTDVSPAAGRQNVKTYAIDVRRLWSNEGDRDMTRVLMNMATYGGGKYFNAQNTNGVAAALRRIFAEVQSVNSVFASSSLPVSVNTQGTYENQIFIGMFRPSSEANPRWAGNLKQYQFIYNGTNLFLADKLGARALNPETGFITPCAISRWTTDSGGYWNYPGAEAIGTCDPATAFSDSPDGEIVEKGGAAEQLRKTYATSIDSRNVKTCATDTANPALCLALSSFNSTTITTWPPSSSPSLSAVTNVADMVNWVRGKDVDDENKNGNSTEPRPSIHGGVVHTQPAIVNYGGSTGVVAYYGADDGMLHAVKGGTGDEPLIGSVQGNELWAFVAPETYGRLQRLRENNPPVDFPGVGAPNKAKEYFFDGSIGVYQQGSSTAWIFPTMRRGGRAVYAFDVTDPTTPVLKWRKGCFTDDTAAASPVCSTDTDTILGQWSRIGQTWSKPRFGYLSGYVAGDGTTLKPVLVFGGGYDTCEDTDSQTRCTGTPKGADIWFVDADSGAVIARHPTSYSVPGEVFLMKDKQDVIKTAYAADTGGYVYRIDVGSYSSASSPKLTATISTIASLSETNQARKFLLGLDVTANPGFNAVLLGSGDRQHPLYTDYACNSGATSPPGSFVTNRFFMIKDPVPAIPSAPIITVDQLTDANSGDAVNDYGWQFGLRTCEQVVNRPLTIGGLTYFGTNQPKFDAAPVCEPDLGTARSYVVNFLNGAPWCSTCYRDVAYSAGGIPPSPVAGVVTVNLPGGSDEVQVPFLLGGAKPPPGVRPEGPCLGDGCSALGGGGAGSCQGDGCSTLGGDKVPIIPLGPRYRVWWNMIKD